MDTPSCIQADANASALRVPVQGVTGAGGRQRNSPTGGAANGTPLYTVNPSARTPDTAPDSVGVIGISVRCASVIADVAGRVRRSKARVKNLEKHIARSHPGHQMTFRMFLPRLLRCVPVKRRGRSHYSESRKDHALCCIALFLLMDAVCCQVDFLQLEWVGTMRIDRNGAMATDPHLEPGLKD
jgi:hypothetical protein